VMVMVMDDRGCDEGEVAVTCHKRKSTTQQRGVC